MMAADNEVPMECTLALVADAANNAEGGKLNVLGIFNQVYSDKFPYQLPQMFVVVRLSAGPAEFGLEKRFEIVLLSPDGDAIGRLKGKGQVPQVKGVTRANMELLLKMVNVPFKKPGSYAISVLVSGEEKASIPLEVVERKVSPPKKRRKKNG